MQQVTGLGQSDVNKQAETQKAFRSEILQDQFQVL